MNNMICEVILKDDKNKSGIDWNQYSTRYLTHKLEQYKTMKEDTWLLSAIHEIREILKKRNRITIEDYEQSRSTP